MRPSRERSEGFSPYFTWLEGEVAHPALPRRPRAVLVEVEKRVEVEALQVLAVPTSPGTRDRDLCARYRDRRWQEEQKNGGQGRTRFCSEGTCTYTPICYRYKNKFAPWYTSNDSQPN